MPHLNIYVPEDIEKKIKTLAKKKNISLSSWLTQIIRNEIEPNHWPEDFFQKTAGKWKGDFPNIEELKVEDVKL